MGGPGGRRPPALGASFEDNPIARYEASGLQLGIGATRNMALSRVTGDLVHILDHDDVLLPGALALLAQKFQQHDIAHEGNWPVRCAGLMMRTEAVRALGGWAGAPADDDIVLFAALCQLGDGWNEETVTWLYRQHAGQTSTSETWRGLSNTGRRKALQRIAALGDAGLQIDPATPLRFGRDSTNVHVGRGLKEPTTT